MSSPFENVAFCGDVDGTNVQRSSSSSGFSGDGMFSWFTGNKNGRGLFSSHGQSSDHQLSSEGTQFLSGQDNFNELVPGPPPQLAADPAHSSGDEMGGQTGLALEDVSTGMEASSFDPALPSLIQGEGNPGMYYGSSQTNANYLGYTSDASTSPQVTSSQAQGSAVCMDQGMPMQGPYATTNGFQWNSAYVAQGGPFNGHSSHNVTRGIHDGASVYNSSESESPAGGARHQEHTAGVSTSSGGEHATGTLTGSRVGSSLDVGNPNPILLPGNNHELISNPSLDSEYSPRVKVRDLLSSLDKQTPEFVPSLSEVYDAGNNGVDTHTIFSDAESAQKFIEDKDIYDDTIPRTLRQQQAIVKVLFKAMKNIDYAKDNENMIGPFRRGKYSDARIEKVCWSIMQACMYRHSNGSLLANFGIKSRQTADISTYAERISKIIQLLTLRKTICKHLLDPFYIFHVVDDPIHALKRVEANKDLNQRKGTYMVLGKRAAEDESAKNSPKPESKKTVTPPTVERIQNGATSSGNPERTMTPQEAIEAQSKASANSSVTAGHSTQAGSETNRKPSGLSQTETISPSPAPKTQVACLDHAQKLNDHQTPRISSPQDTPAGKSTPGHSNNSSSEFGVTSSKEDREIVVFNRDDDDDDDNNEQGSTGQSQPSSTVSPVIGRKRGALELDEATVPKKRHLSSGSGVTPSSENGPAVIFNNNNNSQNLTGQSQSFPTVSPRSSRKRGASEWDEAAAVSKKRRS